MRDLVVQEALKAMARDAAKRFRELVAGGKEIPYDVEEAGNGSPLPRYIPLTERFIGDHATALLELDSFGSGCAAIESAGLAGPYLEELGIAVPTDERRRAELAGIAFLCRLWAESTDFPLDGDRLAAAVSELEDGGEAADDEIEIVVPVRGLQLGVTRLELASATIVSAETVEVPAEARASEGGGGAGWEPVFLAAARVSAREVDNEDPEPKADTGARAVVAFRQLITTLRLFKAGSVGLGPHAWTRAGNDRWRRIATGAGRSGPGGYRLAEDELADLMAFSRTLGERSTPFSGTVVGHRGPSRVLARAISRFEAGLERGVALEALNDYLLALRFLLEGGGPADLSLSMRVAALCAEPGHRAETKAVIDRGLTLERQLWSGEPPTDRDDGPPPAATTAAIEDLARAILKDAVCGHLGPDLRSTADEILLADGLAVGEGRAEQRGGPEEWDLSRELEDDEPSVAEDDRGPHATDSDEPDEAAPEHHDLDESEGAIQLGEAESNGPESGDPVSGLQEGLWMDGLAEWERGRPADEERPGMQVPEPAGRITVESHPEPEEQNVFRGAQRHPDPPTITMEAVQRNEDRVAELLEEGPQERQQTSDRVAYLFPRPEPTEWDVRELSYDRRRRASVRAT